MKPVLYRPGPRWPLVAAFAAAAAIHVSALAFSPAHRPELTNTIGVPEIDIEPAPADPEPTPESPIPEPEAMPQTADPDVLFYDEIPRQTPHPSRKPKRPLRPNIMQGQPQLAARNGKVFALSAPRPDYPYEARSRHITGSGAIVLDVDSTSGSVVNAMMTESTGSLLLDHSAMAAFRRWRFKPGTPPRVRIPFTFTIFGAQL